MTPQAALPGQIGRRIEVRTDRGGLMLLTVLGISLAWIVITLPPGRFFDYDAYLLYLDSIYYFPQSDWYAFEGATKVYLLFLRAISGSTRDGIHIAHYLLPIIFLSGFLFIFRKSPWETAGIAAALFAPQLGLITIRATPAYLICTLAAMRAIRGDSWALRLALVGTMFHVSAFLALIPIVGIKIISCTRMARFNLNLPMVLGVAVSIGAIFFLFSQQVFNFLVDLFNQIPYLSKYTAYAVGLADPNTIVEQTVREPTSANHYVFLAGMTVLFLGLVMLERSNALLKLFAAISYVLYLAIFLAFSPVPAFRFAPFFALPILASIRLSGGNLLRGVAAVPFAIVCAGVFAIQVSLVIE